jgi:amidohydrolase
MVSPQDIKNLAKKYFPLVQEVRRHLHRHPELSFQEFETSAYICNKLKDAGIEFTTGHVKTGIIALIKGTNPDKRTILLRGDMDALPIEEENNVEYRSTRDGLMHACGHDAHSASVLGAALILNDLRDRFQGTVKIMFQPGEELLPGGANLMIKDGVLKNPDVHNALALHVFPAMETGKVGFRPGMYMASTDELYLTVNGKGGHAAMPDDYINPLIVASEIILEINDHFMSSEGKKGTPADKIPTVVAFGKIEGRGRYQCYSR